MTQDPMQNDTHNTPEPIDEQPQGPKPRVVKRRRKAGALEAVVALSILVCLSGVLMPAISTKIAGAKVDAAILDMQRIASGLVAYSMQTLTFPTGKDGRTNVACLYGPGEIPPSSFAQGSETRPLKDVLLTDAMGGKAWDGPYVSKLVSDPWGRAYLVNAEGWVLPSQHAMVVSAGPDGIIQTTARDTSAVADDILLIVD